MKNSAQNKLILGQKYLNNSFQDKNKVFLTQPTLKTFITCINIYYYLVEKTISYNK